MKTIPLIWSLLFLAAPVAFAGEVEGGGKGAGWRGFIGYRPAIASGWEDVPSEIRTKVVAHLKDRLGEAFFAQLEFTGGQIVDFAEMDRVTPRYQNRHEEIPRYDLHFRFQRPELGITGYEAQIKLRGDGNIMEEIDLPAFRTNPGKLNLVPFAAVKAVAAFNGVTHPTQAAMGYSKADDSLYWVVTERVKEARGTTVLQNVEISAHDCTVRRKYETKLFH